MPTNYKRKAPVEKITVGDKDKDLDSQRDIDYFDGDNHLEKDYSGLAKKPRLDTPGKPQSDFQNRLAAKLDAPSDAKLSINKANLKNLSEDLTKDKIAEIRAKLISNRRTRIKPEDDDAVGAAGKASAVAEIDGGREVADIVDRERNWRNRSTILQSTGKVALN